MAKAVVERVEWPVGLVAGARVAAAEERGVVDSVAAKVAAEVVGVVAAEVVVVATATCWRRRRTRRKTGRSFCSSPPN